MHAFLAALVLVLAGAGGPPDPGSRGDSAARGVWPLDPRPAVVRGFDPPDDPWGAGHRGVDLLGHVGQQVHASRAGTVTWAGVLAGRGVVVVDHGAERTTYEPVASTVRVGDRVAAGAVIGTLQLGMSHCFPRACLHWGLIRGDTYLNPLLLVGGGPVRLLPLDGVPSTETAGTSHPAMTFVGPHVVLTPGGAPVGMPHAVGRS